MLRLPEVLIAMALATASSFGQGHRPPAVPLVTHDPYFSIWSTTNHLNDGPTRHWTGKEHALTSLIRVDGKAYRLMGNEPADVPALPQVGLEVFPTRTIYRFQNDSVEVVLTFTSPTLPDDLDLLSTPATYLNWAIHSRDGREHKAEVYIDAAAAISVNSPEQEVAWSRRQGGVVTLLRVGSTSQNVLGSSGDDHRIDWGHLYLGMHLHQGESVITSQDKALGAFLKGGKFPYDDHHTPRAANDGTPVLAFSIPFGQIGSAQVQRHVVLAYDDEYSVQYFGQNLRPYWARKEQAPETMIRKMDDAYAAISARCEAFDKQLVADMTRVGGEEYAYLGSLAYRQTFAAQKVVADANGQPLMFSKENFSNGCMGTVDVLYPAAPALLLFSPALAKASLVPILEYAASPRWKWPFAPHDLGTYPLANGQVYGGGERTEDNQMPVEESGNMLILLAALAKVEGNADFSAKYWPTLTRWAAYLADKGFDPERQLSTDDFAGHLAHNVNLSAKAIEALGSFAYLCEARGLKADADRYRALAVGFAQKWVAEAAEGDHYRLAFDKPGTWSQKYNLVWDRLLDLNLFPATVARTEMDYYLRHQNEYGLPLDSRRDYTKLDWIVWTATLTGKREDFDALVKPIVRFLDSTPDRVPMTDWFRTLEPRKEGFQARSVVGGVFIKMLEDKALWRKYAKQGSQKVGDWAPLPKPPVITEVVPTSMNAPITWSFTIDKPTANWFKPEYDAGSWKSGPGGFGTDGTPGAVVRTKWDTSDVWIRRTFDWVGGAAEGLSLYVHHDEDAEIYINGILVAKLPGFVAKYSVVSLTPAGKAAIRPGKNVIAVHCHQTGGGQYIDVGLATVKFEN